MPPFGVAMFTRAECFLHSWKDGVRGLCPGTPSKNQIGIPRSSVAARPARPGGTPYRFSSCSPSPGLADGQRFMRRFCAEPSRQRHALRVPEYVVRIDCGLDLLEASEISAPIGGLPVRQV